MLDLAADLIPDPDYGNGVFRRRVRLTGSPGQVLAELEDSFHGFRLNLQHNGSQVTDINAESLRTPFDACSGALQPLKALIGTTLNTPTPTIYREVNPKLNCTHLYDLSLLAIAHALRGDVTRQLDLTIADELDTPTQCLALLDGEILLDWRIQAWIIKEPSRFNGQSIYKGFSRWAAENLSSDELEAALMLQKSYFVAQARKYDISQMAGTPAQDSEAMQNACYTYTPGVVETAKRMGTNVRDFTNTPELLLKFVP